MHSLFIETDLLMLKFTSKFDALNFFFRFRINNLLIEIQDVNHEVDVRLKRCQIHVFRGALERQFLNNLQFIVLSYMI